MNLTCYLIDPVYRKRTKSQRLTCSKTTLLSRSARAQTEMSFPLYYGYLIWPGVGGTLLTQDYSNSESEKNDIKERGESSEDF